MENQIENQKRTQTETPISLMEYRLHQNFKKMGIQCHYNKEGKMTMWIRIKPQNFLPPSLKLMTSTKDSTK